MTRGVEGVVFFWRDMEEMIGGRNLNGGLGPAGRSFLSRMRRLEMIMLAGGDAAEPGLAFGSRAGHGVGFVL